MNTIPLPSGIQNVIAATVWVLVALTVIVLPACTRQQPSIYGIYRIYSDDPSVQQFIAGQDTYLQLNEDRTIIYNTTINGVPKFHIEGTFTQKDTEITVAWKEGKLPATLKIETQETDQVIRIGTTVYKKERSR